MDLIEKLVWQPIIYSGQTEFQVAFDRKFVIDMMNAKLTDERQINFNKLANNFFPNFKLPIAPYKFYENTCFVRGFEISGNGRWLAGHCPPENYLKEETSKPVIYYSHNVDDSYDAYQLMALVSLWIDYADNLRKK